MILSVSRRTDIPAFYSEWFMNRIREKSVMVRNPLNYHSISCIDLSPEIVDCIVFWSKNPKPLFKYLDELDLNYRFYFQYTINAYDKDLEPNLPNLDERINNFIFLSKRYGKERVVWRYDPIIITEKYSQEWHLDQFEHIAKKLNGYVSSCVFSFIDIYDKNKNNLNKAKIQNIEQQDMIKMSVELREIADKYNIKLRTCCEEIDLKKYGIEKSCCIDPNLISKIINCKIKAVKDKNQRPSCGCVESIDIGQYNTCKHGCIYCYANYSSEAVKNNCKKHIPTSPLLLGEKEPEDKVNIRKVKTLKELQATFFD